MQNRDKITQEWEKSKLVCFPQVTPKPPGVLETFWALDRMTLTVIWAVVWTAPRFLVTKVVSVAMTPIWWCIAAVAAVTWPLRYVVGAVVKWVLDEFDVSFPHNGCQ